jgi:hypothetical protein
MQLLPEWWSASRASDWVWLAGKVGMDLIALLLVGYCLYAWWHEGSREWVVVVAVLIFLRILWRKR